MQFFPDLTANTAVAKLATLGVSVTAADVVLTRRDTKWVVTLPGDRAAWFAASHEGLAGMVKERRVLDVLAHRCRFPIPRVLATSSDGRIDVRRVIPCSHDADAIVARLQRDVPAARQVGAALGAILADLHSSVPAADCAGWLDTRPDWPGTRPWVRERLPEVIRERSLLNRADVVMAEYQHAIDETAANECALVHTDLGFHNVSVNSDSLEVRGVFDWESACWADRHLDFRYLLFDAEQDALFDSAVAAYEVATRRAISRRKVHLYNAAAAVGYLAFRHGVAADLRWCGRTLDEDLSWTRLALARLDSA